MFLKPLFDRHFLNILFLHFHIHPDNTAGIVTLRSGFWRRAQEIYHLPVVIEDSGYPVQSSTGMLTIRVCGCDSDGSLLTCSAEAIFLPVGLSTGALIAILLCIVILLGEWTAGCDQIGMKTNLIINMDLKYINKTLCGHAVQSCAYFIRGECGNMRLAKPKFLVNFFSVLFHTLWVLK